MGDYESEKMGITKRFAIALIAPGVLAIALFLILRLGPILVMLFLIVAEVAAIAWYFRQVIALGKRYGKF